MKLFFRTMTGLVLAAGLHADATEDAVKAIAAKDIPALTAALEAGADVNAKVGFFKATLLHTACKTGVSGAVKVILEKEGKNIKDINDADNMLKSTPLQLVSLLYKPEDMAKSNQSTYAMYEKLWADHEDKEEKLAKLKTTLVASENPADYPEPADMALWLIKAGANVNVKDGASASPLHRAIERKSTKLVQVLLEAGADVEARHGLMGLSQFPTPLFKAALMNDAASVRLLRSFGADTEAKMKEYKVDATSARLYNVDTERLRYFSVENTPASLAKVLGHEEALAALLEDVQPKPAPYGAAEVKAPEKAPAAKPAKK